MRSVTSFAVVALALAVFGLGTALVAQTDQLHTPAKDSAERKAILGAVAEEYKGGDDHPTQFTVNYLKVHNGWAWINVTPLNAGSNPVGDPAPLLFHSENGKWVNKDLYAVPTPESDHVGPQEPSAGFVRSMQKKYPGVPADIVPVKRH